MGNDLLKRSSKEDEVEDPMPPQTQKVVTDHDNECLLNASKLDDYKNNPIGLFQQWFQQTFQHSVDSPFIMSLASVSADGIPSIRPVAMCNVDEKGFYFATDIESNKVKDFQVNPHVAACFYWPKLDRAVRIEGEVEKADDGGKCYHLWPRTAQIAHHSRFRVEQPMEDRSEYVKDLEQLTVKFAEVEKIPQPENVQAYRIKPYRMEFVQEHLTQPADRILFKSNNTGEGFEVVALYS